jgi:hypothetical protein
MTADELWKYVDIMLIRISGQARQIKNGRGHGIEFRSFPAPESSLFRKVGQINRDGVFIVWTAKKEEANSRTRQPKQVNFEFRAQIALEPGERLGRANAMP